MARYFTEVYPTRLNTAEERPYSWDPEGYRYDWGYGENPHYWDYTPRPYYHQRPWYAPYGEGYEGYGHPPEEQDMEYNRVYGEQEAGPYVGVGPRGYQRSDARIDQDVCDRLTAHGHVDATDIEVDVHNGEVTLRGTVDDRRSKRLAEDIAESVVGVVDVNNELRVRRGMRGSNETINPRLKMG